MTTPTTPSSEGGDGWRDFSSAPQNGTPFLARYQWQGENRYMVIRKHKNSTWWVSDHDRLVKQDDGNKRVNHFRFTHWQSIDPPSQPQIDEENRK